MAKNRPSYLTLGSTQVSELRDLAGRGNGFFHIGASEIPSIIPEGLRGKSDSAVIVVSPTADAMAVVLHRIDDKAGMMDHHPFLIRLSGLIAEGNGVLVNHAAFLGRSVPLPDDLNLLTTGNYYKNQPPFGLSSGSTSQLHPSLFQAIDIAQRALGSTAST